MINEYYKFNPEDVYRFGRAVGGKHRVEGNQYSFAVCPYCHGGRNTDKKTFYISLETGQFECKRSSCSVRGNMITLAKDFSDVFSLGEDVKRYYRIDGANDRFKRFKDSHRITESKEPAIAYMMSRGISEETCKKYEITTKHDQSNVIVFPFKDENGELNFIKYRNATYQKGDKGSKEWTERDCMPILFGMNHCEDPATSQNKTLVITEGQIDSLSLSEAGIKNVVSVPTGKNGFTWKPHCWDWLTKFDEIVVFGDNENGEITLAKEISAFFPKTVRIVKVESYQNCKDANEILQKYGKQALIDAVNDAETVIDFRIKNIAEIEDVDLDSLPAFPTGFAELDRKIGGGFHEGEVNILTGKCGEGKSTFASMIIAQMMKNEVKTFCYSGELPGYMFKRWLYDQLAGTKDIKEAMLNRINDWANSRLYLYDNSSILDSPLDVFELIEKAVKQLKVKFIVIDNLMTAMEQRDDQELYRQQGNFLTRLTKLAKGYNICILLIAHPRKGDGIGNDTISGSGDITNRANVVLRFQRDKDSDQSLIFITKNRTTGELLNSENSALRTIYNPNNMRLRLINEREHEFLPEEEPTDGFEQIELEDVPF